jgi:hypothetical protein
MTVQGNSVTLPTGTESYSAIDTGTTLIGGPSSAISSIFAQIPGSAPGTGNFEGYFTYRESIDERHRGSSNLTSYLLQLVTLKSMSQFPSADRPGLSTLPILNSPRCPTLNVLVHSSR